MYYNQKCSLPQYLVLSLLWDESTQLGWIEVFYFKGNPGMVLKNLFWPPINSHPGA